MSDRMTDRPEFTIHDLKERGFEGFVAVPDLKAGLASPPQEPGVYVVVREQTTQPRFIETSPASWFKGQDPTVPVDRLHVEWVAEAQTLYIGSGCNLADRIRLLVEFSDAGPHVSVFHRGGRLLWQLADAQKLIVAWKAEPPGESSTERDFVDEFRSIHGAMPFANLRRPPIRVC